MNIRSPEVQKKYTSEWNTLDADKKEPYFQAANETNKYYKVNNISIIENLSKRKSELNKQIKELRKIVSVMSFIYYSPLIVNIKKK